MRAIIKAALIAFLATAMTGCFYMQFFNPDKRPSSEISLNGQGSEKAL
jgi:hypothetical protein